MVAAALAVADAEETTAEAEGTAARLQGMPNKIKGSIYMPKRQLWFIPLFLMILLMGCSSENLSKLELGYQEGADKKRIEDVHHIAGLIEDFHDKVGYYPLANDFTPPIEVLITNKKYNYSLPTLPLANLENELEYVLDREINLPLDPQKVDALGGQRLYQYFTNGKDYTLSAFLFYQTEFTLPKAEHSYMYQVSSRNLIARKAFSLKEVRAKRGGRRVDAALQKELAEAVKTNNTSAAGELLTKGALLDPVCTFNFNCRALSLAIVLGSNQQMIEFLISKGADVNAPSALDDAPLIKALGSKHPELVSVLLKAGADVNQPNAWGITPFIGASMGGDMEMVRNMLALGGDVNRCFPNYTNDTKPCNNTPLRGAALYGHAGVVKLLLKEGADPNALTDKGESALDFARGKSHTEVIEILAKYTKSES
ncbi:MAG: ankyrin repeat domain-containing protein [Thermodesulfobacteriota bacterium]